MQSPQVSSPSAMSFTGQSSMSRSSTRLDDVASLTSFNPFSEEDENDQSSYTLVSSLLSRMKNTLAAPLTSAVAAASGITPIVTNSSAEQPTSEPRRPSFTLQNSQANQQSRDAAPPKMNPFTTVPSQPAPPLMSLTPAVFDTPSYHVEYDRSYPNFYAPSYDHNDSGAFGTSIPGFPIQDDARSIRTATSFQRPASVSKVIRRLRGEGLSRDYWMDDENCKECFDCQGVFTTWRRKHHCRICGQIFCSRCASNIIKGARFGHDGAVRVCNLCLEKLAKVDDEDEDDHRSVVSAAASFPAHQFGYEAISLSRQPHSPFTAAKLFGRTDEPFNLFSIAETKRQQSGSEDSAFGSGPGSPQLVEGENGVWQPVRENPAPFRRALSEEKEPVYVPAAFTPSELVSSKSVFAFPSTKSVAIDIPTSTVQFPVSSPDRGHDNSQPQSRLRSRFNSYNDHEAPTPFIRSRVQSRLDDFFGEPGWRTRRESTAYAQELNLTSMLHLRIMLRQMLTKEKIPNIKEWEEVLLKLALKIARELTFTSLPHRQGEDMDVRRYVKIKKIPGGKPQNSEFVDGAVITKNVAHKKMSRFQRNPRVMLVTFPLEYNRVEGQYIHFGQVVRQEKEYLTNLASRIAALRPHVVLVEKSVSRLALEALSKHNIAVARVVKPSAVRFVARMTQGDVFSSVDKLALEPRLGHCGRYSIQTFDHELIPGRRKSYMRFEGCSHDVGCTIILRGGDFDTLKRIKKVTRFLTFIVRNLKLETHLWKDSVITMPAFNADSTPTNFNATGRPIPTAISISSIPLLHASLSTPQLLTPALEAVSERARVSSESGEGDVSEDLPDDEAEQARLSRRIQQSLEPYTKTFISVSATLRFPPPYPIRKMKELDLELAEAKRAWEDEVVLREERSLAPGPDVNTGVLPTPVPLLRLGPEQDDINAQIAALPTAGLELTPSPLNTPHVNLETSYFTEKLPASIAVVETSSDTAPCTLRSVEDIALESRLSFVRWQHTEQRRIWEWYLRKNSDDFVAEKYQCISLQEFTVPIAEFGLRRACFAPRLIYITFYGENDCTLGQYIEKAVTDTLVQFLDPKAICAGKGCNQPLARHCQVYVHNETRIFFAVEQWDGQIKGRTPFPAPDLVTTWSACRICGSATPFIPVSEEMLHYSFAKFLELHFYPADVKIFQGAGCQHNIYQHHIRYFAFKGMTVRFQTDPIVLNEIVYPPVRIRIRPETQLQMKNEDFQKLHNRNNVWYSALVDDLQLISMDAATGDEEADAKLLIDINALIMRAVGERGEIARMINKIYRDESSPTDTLALNQVRSFRQDKIVAWQQDFDRLPKSRAPQLTMERTTRKASAFNSMRAIWPRKYDLPQTFDLPHVPSSSVSEAEDANGGIRRPTGDTLASSASEASEPEYSNELVPHNQKKPTAEQKEQATESPTELKSETDLLPEQTVKSDPESDSTIKDEPVVADAETHKPSFSQEPSSRLPTNEEEPVVPRASRLPRRPSHQPSVADLVKKYQDYIPSQSVQELAKTAFPPLMSESEQEYAPTTLVRGKIRKLAKKSSVSDFEQGYAANAANIPPRHLARRNLGHGHHKSRIPGPIGSPLESKESSRRPSPEKRAISGRANTGVRFARNTSPSPGNRSVSAAGKNGRAKVVQRSTKVPAPTTGKSTFRRASAPGNKVSNIAKHFERINRDNERANRRYAVIRGRRARPVASARATVEVLESIQDAIRDESDSLSSSSEADDERDGDDEQKLVVPDPAQKPETTDPPVPDVVVDSTLTTLSEEAPLTSNLLDSQELVFRPPTDQPIPSPKVREIPPAASPTSELDIPAGTERNSIMKAISGLWIQQPPQPRHRAEVDVDDPMSDPEHIFRDSSMVVRMDEPTSIIALALNSPQYREMLSKSRAEKRNAREPKVTDGGEAFMPDDRSVAESSSTWGVVNVESTEAANPTDELRVPSSKLPWAISFESGGLTISCTVLYPEQFDALRRTYDCEKSMIESLARCVKWNATGGKSGSAFLKTRDDRFIAKELSKPELQTMETFAPAYFDYMSSAVTANRPTLLAKVFGCYKLTFGKGAKDKGSSNNKGKSTQMNLLVMENLFYDRSFSRIYDLKGSTRNRHVQSTGRENEVLLDENLVQTAHLNPFYLREHSKRILRGALYNDSKFLADINVMDYSLVVGFDVKKNELVVGIVDYIRTYTWDKKLESWVKETVVGTGKGEPTIVTPKQYRQRFISAMERYFPLVPDRWMKQKDTPEEDPNSLVELWPDW